MTRVAIRINDPSCYRYWSNNTDHGSGWKATIDSETMWGLDAAMEQIATINNMMSLPTLTLVPIKLPLIEVCEQDYQAISGMIRKEISRKDGVDSQLRDILLRLKIK